ncbi:hypothetical protein [Bradyrhizobium japonicum]|uniref:hypothetical protein n=1 Tax=Bradyrhizobium japonicum TaxID=375 RepID=UPI0020A104FB|nr:hypothetical protein [Bradyrhizobium japonicum]MCP1761933.1 hypothetical protein [Bradyrhizobium japonicum]MCP1793513.1 hypothetical protein [Bradyrhizobium japonicum]MCP1805946.1 hypothetical protein [Bradyrhizobium japonicum]MCP1812349.1 hypothetical protein [Bradyrhizobium japonicum]MCP1873608.1 hypothetical protein [Bradyrhizobium japonicum]
MGTIGKLATGVAESLKGQPLALALVVINLLFLSGFAVMLREIAQAVERKDALLTLIASHCLK